MSTTIVKKNISIPITEDFSIEGDLVHDDDQRLLYLDTEEGPERFSVNLEAYGAATPAGHVWIKDWSEHEGLTEELVSYAVVRIVATERFGPFSAKAHLVRVLS